MEYVLFNCNNNNSSIFLITPRVVFQTVSINVKFDARSKKLGGRTLKTPALAPTHKLL